MKHAFIILLLTPLFLVSCQAGSQRGRIDVSADSIPVEMTEGHDVMSDQEKEDSIKFASYLQLFKDTASVEVSIGSKLFGFSLVSPDEFYQKMEQYRDLYPVSADSSLVVAFIILVSVCKNIHTHTLPCYEWEIPKRNILITIQKFCWLHTLCRKEG